MVSISEAKNIFKGALIGAPLEGIANRTDDFVT
jgi:hypothetical protein